jgi:hypothetical protein
MNILPSAYSTDQEAFQATDEVAHDYALIAARLDQAASSRHLQVSRYKTLDICYHFVQLIVEEENGEIYSLEMGGYISIAELNHDAHSDREFPFKKEALEGGKVRIQLMITDEYPDDPFFLREDGQTKVNLGFNDKPYYVFEVTLFEEDLKDNF